MTCVLQKYCLWTQNTMQQGYCEVNEEGEKYCSPLYHHERVNTTTTCHKDLRPVQPTVNIPVGVEASVACNTNKPLTTKWLHYLLPGLPHSLVALLVKRSLCLTHTSDNTHTRYHGKAKLIHKWTLSFVYISMTYLVL